MDFIFPYIFMSKLIPLVNLKVDKNVNKTWQQVERLLKNIFKTNFLNLFKINLII